MEILAILIPVSLGLGATGLLAFLWTLRHSQYDDPSGDAARILNDTYDLAPKRVDPPSVATKH
jgi:cbb3-type cytochrome oxidase maturation protein